jgi:biotin operon repressor
MHGTTEISRTRRSDDMEKNEINVKLILEGSRTEWCVDLGPDYPRLSLAGAEDVEKLARALVRERSKKAKPAEAKPERKRRQRARKALGNTDKAVLTMLAQLIERREPASVKAVADRLGLSRGHVSKQFRRLRHLGYVNWVGKAYRQHRGVQILRRHDGSAA